MQHSGCVSPATSLYWTPLSRRGRGDGGEGRFRAFPNCAALLLAALCAAVFLPVRPSAAQDAAAVGSGVARRMPVQFTAAATPPDPRPGEAVTVTVRAAIEPGWHLYAPASAAPKDTPATVSDITALGSWQPQGETRDDTAPVVRMDPNFNAKVAFHEGSASMSRGFRVPETGGNPPPAAATFRFEVCNDKVCLPPRPVAVPVVLTVGQGPVRAQYRATAVVAASGSAAQQGPLFFLLAFGSGLLALVTPCVFPLIPITLASFAKQANGDRGRLVRMAVGYALGVAALYVAVGGVMSVFAGAAGANRLAANPYVNLFAFVVFVVFALSFFETVQISLPSALTGSVQKEARSRSGWVSLALLGIVFVLASFTCTAPFIGTLLVASAGGERLRPLLGMTVFALAFTSPFLVFAAFPGLLTRLPKSGAWLARVKATLGFIELAASLKFLSNADIVFGWRLLTAPVLLAAWALLFFLASLYLLGVLRFGVVAETENPAGERIPAPRAIWAGVFAGISLYCFYGLSGRPLHPAVETFLPPPGYGPAGGAAASAGGGSAASPGTAILDGMEWRTEYDAALAEAKAEHKRLFVDFTGYACTNCRWNERNVFPDSGVKSELAKFVRVQLYADGGPDADKNQNIETKTFGDIALPLYGVVDPETGTVIAKTAGVQRVGDFTTFLRGAEGGDAATASAASAPLWQPYSDAALAAATAAGKPVVVDFTASWCVNCKEIEKEVFDAPPVRDRLAKETVTLRGDLTQWASPESAALQKKWGFDALPTILLIDAKGNEVKSLRITGRLPIADFQKRLDALNARR